MTYPRIDVDEIMDAVRAAIFEYPMKAMASDIGKQYPTLSNELGHRDDFKLGFITFLKILEATQRLGDPNNPSRLAGLRMLDKIEESVNRVAYQIPDASNEDVVPVMEMMANMSREFGESIRELATAIKDGKLSSTEAKRCAKENRELIKACVTLQGYLDRLQ